MERETGGFETIIWAGLEPVIYSLPSKDIFTGMNGAVGTSEAARDVIAVSDKTSPSVLTRWVEGECTAQPVRDFLAGLDFPDQGTYL